VRPVSDRRRLYSLCLSYTAALPVHSHLFIVSYKLNPTNVRLSNNDDDDDDDDGDA